MTQPDPEALQKLLAELEARRGRDWRVWLTYGIPGYFVGAGLGAFLLQQGAALGPQAGQLVLPGSRLVVALLFGAWLALLLRGVWHLPGLRRAATTWGLIGATLGAGVMLLFALSF